MPVFKLFFHNLETTTTMKKVTHKLFMQWNKSDDCFRFIAVTYIDGEMIDCSRDSRRLYEIYTFVVYDNGSGMLGSSTISLQCLADYQETEHAPAKFKDAIATVLAKRNK